MTKKTPFEFNDYKAFLKDVEQFRGAFQRGFRSRLAEALGVQNAFISQVLNTDAHFGLEQAMKIAVFLGLDVDEKQYFLWLVEYARAGTKELRKFFEDLLIQLKNKNLEIKERVEVSAELGSEDKTTYYSQWYYAAIHVAVTIPELRKPAAIADALGIPIAAVQKAILFLVSCGLLKEKSGTFVPGPTQLHIDRNAPQIFNHHANWRMMAVQSLMKERPTDVRYSTVSSLSLKDVEVLRSRFVQMIQDYVETVKVSPEQTLCCFNLDFFRLMD